MGRTDNFFEKKKEWSKFKDAILKKYLTPYIAKILSTKRPLIIIDCFAGKGKFDDGNIGSPIIIAEHIRNVLQKNSYRNKEIHGYFIESKYANELKENLTGYKRCKVLRGTFEENIQKILNWINRDINLFLYLDPYGIKSLDFNYIKRLVGSRFKSLELLMNFNSFGFLREGARLLKYSPQPFEQYEDIDYEVEGRNNIKHMDSIANGDYWQDFLKEKYERDLSMLDVEERFFQEYSNKFNAVFDHTVNIPIKKKMENLPKYRLIFGTNHPHGLLLMVDRMNKAWKDILDKTRGRQQDIFGEFAFPGIITEDEVKRQILDILAQQKDWMLLDDLLVKLVKKYGISFNTKECVDMLKLWEGKKIKVGRVPKLTPKIGQKSRFWTWGKSNKVFLKIK